MLKDLLEPIKVTESNLDEDQESESLCKVWWREAVKRLDTEGIINCPSVDKLEEECAQYALGNQASQPGWGGYKYYISKYSA